METTSALLAPMARMIPISDWRLMMESNMALAMPTMMVMREKALMIVPVRAWASSPSNSWLFSSVHAVALRPVDRRRRSAMSAAVMAGATLISIREMPVDRSNRARAVVKFM